MAGRGKSRHGISEHAMAVINSGLLEDMLSNIVVTVSAENSTKAAPTRSYKPSPIKRARRTKADVTSIESAIYNTLAADHPQTLRGLFYQLESQGVIPKTEAAYKGIVGRLCARMRRSGQLPYCWLADNTRWMRKPASHTGLEAALRRTAETYRRAVWADLPVYVEVWLEKDALADVVYEETEIWDVPLMVTRGYPSLTYLYSAAAALQAQEKPAYLYYLGDHDPAGVDIPRKVETDLRAFAPDVEIHFERLAVTEQQIDLWHLPTRPTKQTDARGKRFVGESVEVDAIPAHRLRTLVRRAIARHIPDNYMHALSVAEESERELLQRILITWPALTDFEGDTQ